MHFFVGRNGMSVSCNRIERCCATKVRKWVAFNVCRHTSSVAVFRTHDSGFDTTKSFLSKLNATELYQNHELVSRHVDVLAQCGAVTTSARPRRSVSGRKSAKTQDRRPRTDVFGRALYQTERGQIHSKTQKKAITLDQRRRFHPGFVGDFSRKVESVTLSPTISFEQNSLQGNRSDRVRNKCRNTPTPREVRN